MIYPEQKKPKHFMWLKKDPPDPNVLVPFKMRKLCMKFYLEKYKTILLSGEFVHQEDFDIHNVVRNINDLFVCCGNQYCGTSEADVYCWSFLTGLKQVSIFTCMHDAVYSIFFALKTYLH